MTRRPFEKPVPGELFVWVKRLSWVELAIFSGLIGFWLLPGFEPHPIVREFLDIIQSGKAAPGVPKMFHHALARASVSLLPPKVRGVLQLGREYDLRASDRIALKIAGALAERVPVRHSPPCQAAVRLGLPHDFLYRSKAAQQQLLAGRTFDQPAAAA